jgi:ABC-type branched-subunit amino acid transport system substrate-binding protein
VNLGKRSAGAALLAAVLISTATGCSNKAQDNSSSGGGGNAADVKTDKGIEGKTINLGVLTDLTGVFAALGKDLTNSNTLYWKDHKVCKTYNVKLDVQDTGYVPQTGVQLYSGMKDNILAMQQTIGSPINAALAPQYQADSIVNFPSAWSKTLTEIPGTGVVGATYDVEISNAYDYLLKKGLLKEGDTVGHIYFEGEYGANGLAGSKAVAEEKGLKIIEAQIKSTDQDMSAQVTQFKAAGVKAIALTVAPTQTASVASVAQAQGLDVPILGNNPVFAPGLLQGSSAQWLKDHLYVASPVSTFDKHQDLLKAYQAAYPDVTPSLGVLVGTGMAALMNQVLDAACDNGDLTRAGVLDAFNNLKDADTGGLVVPIRGFESGKSPSLESFVLQPADAPGGAKLLQDATEGEFAAKIGG